MKECTICNRTITSEEPQILAMSAYGTPKYVCDECGGDLEEATLGRDPEKIAAAMDRIGTRLASTNPNKSTFLTVNTIMEEAANRAKLIKECKYDFSLDEEEDVEDDDGFEEVPEELQETEEDRELDRQEEERLRKFDKFYNVFVGIVIAATAGIIIWRIIDVLL